MVRLSELKIQFCCLFHLLKISNTILLAKMHSGTVLGRKNSEINQCLEPGSCREADSNLVGFTLKPKERVLTLRSTQHLGHLPGERKGGMRAQCRTRGARPAGKAASRVQGFAVG